MALTCLLVEDDLALADRIVRGLEGLGHHVRTTASAAEAERTARDQAFDVVILDRMLPDGDSASALQGWRAAGLSAPVVMLSAMSALHERLDGIESGADDYLGKPFEIAELEARLRALVRLGARSGGGAAEVTRVGEIEIDHRRREVRRAGMLVPLQPREFKLLDLLVLHAGEAVPRSVLLDKVWNLRFDPRTKLIETHMSRLRDKLNQGHTRDLIHTVRGVGYRFSADD